MRGKRTGYNIYFKMGNSVYVAGGQKFDLQKHIHNETYSAVSNNVLQEIYLKPYDE